MNKTNLAKVFIYPIYFASKVEYLVSKSKIIELSKSNGFVKSPKGIVCTNEEIRKILGIKPSQVIKGS